MAPALDLAAESQVDTEPQLVQLGILFPRNSKSNTERQRETKQNPTLILALVC